MLFESQDADLLIASDDNLLNRVANLDVSKVTPPKPKRSSESQYRDNVSEESPDGRREMRKDLEYTTAERSLGAALSRIDTAENVSKVIGASVSQIGNWKNGITSRVMAYEDRKIRPELVDNTRKKLNEIRDVAMDKLLMTLGVIKDVDVNLLGAKDASIVAGNLSKVVEKTLPKNEETSSRPQVVMYAPVQQNIEQYNVIET